MKQIPDHKTDSKHIAYWLCQIREYIEKQWSIESFLKHKDIFQISPLNFYHLIIHLLSHYVDIHSSKTGFFSNIHSDVKRNLDFCKDRLSEHRKPIIEIKRPEAEFDWGNVELIDMKVRTKPLNDLEEKQYEPVTVLLGCLQRHVQIANFSLANDLVFKALWSAFFSSFPFFTHHLSVYDLLNFEIKNIWESFIAQNTDRLIQYLIDQDGGNPHVYASLGSFSQVMPEHQLNYCRKRFFDFNEKSDMSNYIHDHFNHFNNLSVWADKLSNPQILGFLKLFFKNNIFSDSNDPFFDRERIAFILGLIARLDPESKKIIAREEIGKLKLDYKDEEDFLYYALELASSAIIDELPPDSSFIKSSLQRLKIIPKYEIPHNKEIKDSETHFDLKAILVALEERLNSLISYDIADMRPMSLVVDVRERNFYKLLVSTSITLRVLWPVFKVKISEAESLFPLISVLIEKLYKVMKNYAGFYIQLGYTPGRVHHNSSIPQMVALIEPYWTHPSSKLKSKISDIFNSCVEFYLKGENYICLKETFDLCRMFRRLKPYLDDSSKEKLSEFFNRSPGRFNSYTLIALESCQEFQEVVNFLSQEQILILNTDDAMRHIKVDFTKLSEIPRYDDSKRYVLSTTYERIILNLSFLACSAALEKNRNNPLIVIFAFLKKYIPNFCIERELRTFLPYCLNNLLDKKNQNCIGLLFHFERALLADDRKDVTLGNNEEFIFSSLYKRYSQDYKDYTFRYNEEIKKLVEEHVIKDPAKIIYSYLDFRDANGNALQLKS